MSTERDHPLTQAFMRAHPAQAAAVLDALPVGDAAALFARAPARLGAVVLAAMLPRRAAACLAALGDARALELLAPMATQPKVALLRQMPGPRRQGLVAGLPTSAALASALLLGFADDTVGAWADPDVVLLPMGTRAVDALERVRQASDPHPLVFVADTERRLAGTVALAALLQAPAGATLAGLMRRPTDVLPAHTPLDAAAAHRGWNHGSALPVIEPGGRLVGVMTRDALARALRRAAPPLAARADATLPVLGARAYWQLLSGLFDGALALLPRVPPLLEATAELSGVAETAQPADTGARDGC